MLRVVRDVDGEELVYDLEVPHRGLVAAMRLENLKPGRLISTTLVSPP